MNEATKGVLALVATFVIWGLSPIYYKLLSHIAPLEVLAHRTLWATVFLGLILVFQRRLGAVGALLRSGCGVVALAAVMISVNWFLFIWAVQVGRAMESSLGYYISPLFAVGIGAVLFKERLARVQWIAVGLALFAVSLLTLGLGVVPLVSLALATTFSVYGALKKRLAAGPVVSVFSEVLLLTPIALAWLAWIHLRQGQGAFGANLGESALLMLSGPLTGGPLILFSYGARRTKMATVGLVAYLNPTLQFICAALIFAEPFTFWHAMTFGLIWLALALYSAQSLASERAARSAAVKVATSGLS